MTGAMYAAVSGLKTHMSAMNVISNNISNVNTVGYKATRYTFNEALYTSVRNGSDGTENAGGRNPAQIGYGCSVGTIDLDMSTKNYNPTGHATDVMIDGDGFFLVDDKSKMGVTTQDKLQGMRLTRLGNFEFDTSGYLVDGNGSVVYGYLRTGDDGETTTPVLTPIRLPYSLLAEDEETGEVNTTVLFPSVVEGEDGAVVRDNEEALDALAETPPNPNYKRVTHDTIQIDEKSGRISLVTSDEQLVVVGYIAIAKVDNPNGVTHVDGRYYQALDGAGQVHLSSIKGVVQYAPDEGGEGEYGSLAIESAGATVLVTGGLETSGTDLAQEITNMIVIQRGYQANTRIVTVTDSMLEELVNMKR